MRLETEIRELEDSAKDGVKSDPTIKRLEA